MKIRTLDEFFSPDRYIVDEITDFTHVRELLESKASATWGQGKIEGTDYYKLVQNSPSSKADKSFIGVAKMLLVSQARLKGCDESEFNAHLAKYPLAIPDGFKPVGSMTQTKFILNGQIIAMQSQDGFGTQYEIADPL